MAKSKNICTEIGTRSMAFLLISLNMIIATAACSGPGSIATSSVPPAMATPSEGPDLNGIVAGSEILVGDRRLPFGLFDFDGNPVEGAEVEVEIYKLHQNGSLVPVSSTYATFQEVHGIKRIHKHVDGSDHDHQEVRGVYVIESVPFAEAGIWEAHLSVSRSNISGTEMAKLTFQVKSQSTTYAVGDTPPPSRNLTDRDVGSLEEITTLKPIVPGLYELTVAKALEGSKPFVVVFSTPAFCVTTMCGPVTDVVVQVYADYRDRVDFIHIEPWDLATIRNEGKMVPTDIALEWRLPTEPWIFVVGNDNRIAARWEGLVTPEELTEALDAVLE